LLVDARRIASITMSAEDLPLIESALHEVSAFREGGRTAVLLGPDAAEQLWRRIPELGPRVARNVAFFHDPEEAQAFLGHPAVPAVMELIAAATPPPHSGNGDGRRRA
jgi:hypothetical protein